MEKNPIKGTQTYRNQFILVRVYGGREAGIHPGWDAERRLNCVV